MNERLSRLLDSLKNYDQRSRYSLFLALAFNLIYALVKLVTGIYCHSAWLIALGVYYAVLAIMRFSLLRSMNRSDGHRVYLRTALSLIFLTVVMGGIFALVVVHNKAYSYPGILIYAMALWAFLKIIVAAVNLIKRHRDENRGLAASRCISFAAALMSILALQTAMIQQFGGGLQFARIMNGIGGIVVTILLIALSVIMIVRHHRAGIER